MNTGNFTLPGEAGYEALTLKLAKRWGADVIRDSDGTKLSDEILQAGYGIYSTICFIREHNEWIKQNPQSRQQTFLCTKPLVAEEGELQIKLLRDFFSEQFEVNDEPQAMKYWQVYDRTTNCEVPLSNWRYDKDSQSVVINTKIWHQYTVSFLAWRIWEEISMYNYVTNNWEKEHLMQLNPYYPAAKQFLLDWLETWCQKNPDTTVVRFTSLFYNFAWIWGADEANRSLFTDWGSYDFTVCPQALDDFAHEYGYMLCAEDFVRQGKYNATHRVPGHKKLDWMEFIGGFVREASKELVSITHKYNKKAYVFYDDSWVGLEPYNGHFEEFGFDGIIKCVFSGFEVRLCAGVPVETHEIRFHPYLFPVGLGGAPTFAPGGHPGKDALNYWVHVRRALLRQKIDRTGLGGYLHLVEDFPDFVEAMDEILGEFRIISWLHDVAKPLILKPKVGIVSAWGKLRTWTLSGHFHETDRHLLMHVLESLAGLPFEVEFLSFEEVASGIRGDIDVIINAGKAGDAWSGGTKWQEDSVVEELTRWVHQGGVYIGIGEPSAIEGYNTYMRMAQVLGVDIDKGEYACHGTWSIDSNSINGLVPEGLQLQANCEIVALKPRLDAAYTVQGSPSITLNRFGNGYGVYLAAFCDEPNYARLLQNLLIYTVSGSTNADGVTDNALTECAIYPQAGKLVQVNNSDLPQSSSCQYKGNLYSTELKPYAMKVMEL